MCVLRIFIILQFRTSLYWAMMGQVKLQPRLTYDKPYSVWLVWPTYVLYFIISRTMCTWMRWALAWDSVASSWRSRLTEKIPISRQQCFRRTACLRPGSSTTSWPHCARSCSRSPHRRRRREDSLSTATAGWTPDSTTGHHNLWGFLPSSFDPELFPLLLRWLSFFRHSCQML